MGTTTNGTDGLRIVSYLNSQQSKVRYTTHTNPTVNQLKSWQQSGFNRIYMGGNMYTTPKPHIGRVKFTKNTIGTNSPDINRPWAYSTNGHFFNLSGYSTNHASTRVTDPYIQRVISTHSGKYDVKYQDLYTATQVHWAKHYYA